MKNSTHAVPLRDAAPTTNGSAVVVSIEGTQVVVRQGAGLKEAAVAFSCLVTPRPGDLVLCAADQTGETYILAILERPGGQDLTVAFPAGASVTAGEGDLVLSGRSVTLGAQDGLNLMSDRAVHQSREAVLAYDEVTARGEELRADFKSMTLLGRTITTIAKEAISRFRNYIRSTEDADLVKAGQLSRKTDGLYSMQSSRTTLLSRKETKIDGERIFMG